MPITQSRMKSVINSARAWESAWKSFRDLTIDAILRHSQGIINTEQFYAELGANASATEPSATIQVTLAIEEQHFNKSARHNAKARERMADMRQKRGLRISENHQGYEPTEIPIMPMPTPKHLQPIPQATADHARATAPAFAPGVDPLANMIPVDAPTPEQLAADAAMMADEGIDEELRNHIAELRKGDQ
jgi:hypothetical protein